MSKTYTQFCNERHDEEMVLADRINKFWRDRGFDAGAFVKREQADTPNGYPNAIFNLVSHTVNGMPRRRINRH